MQKNENVIFNTDSLGGAQESLPSVCLPSAALCSQGMAYLYQLAAWGRIGHCLKTLGTQEPALLPPVSISVAQGSVSVPGQPCFLSSPVANSWHLFLGSCWQLSI